MTTCPQLTHNTLWTTPAHLFCSLPSLTSLNLSTNNLQEVSDLGISPPSDNTPCLRTLKHLDLSFNQLRSLPARAFPHLTSLQQLSLEGNQLNSLEDDSFSGLALLEMINLWRGTISQPCHQLCGMILLTFSRYSFRTIT